MERFFLHFVLNVLCLQFFFFTKKSINYFLIFLAWKYQLII